jgi:hypothetical protein
VENNDNNPRKLKLYREYGLWNTATCTIIILEPRLVLDGLRRGHVVVKYSLYQCRQKTGMKRGNYGLYNWYASSLNGGEVTVDRSTGWGELMVMIPSNAGNLTIDERWFRGIYRV